MAASVGTVLLCGGCELAAAGLRMFGEAKSTNGPGVVEATTKVVQASTDWLLTILGVRVFGADVVRAGAKIRQYRKGAKRKEE
jgi:hypothetical protein